MISFAASNRLNAADHEAGAKIFWIRSALSATAVLEPAICCCLAAEIAEFFLHSLIRAAKQRLSGPVGSEWLVQSPQVLGFPGCSCPGATPFRNRKPMKFARHVIKYQRFRATSDARQKLRGGVQPR
jgi:hypothetical protein